MIWLKCLFLCLAIVYGFSNICKAVRGLRISSAQLWLMSIGAVGFIAMEFYI